MAQRKTSKFVKGCDFTRNAWKKDILKEIY